MDILTQLIDVIRISLQQGLLYSVLTLGIVLSFYVIRFPDLTVDGSFALGAALAAAFSQILGVPAWGVVAAFIGGGTAGLLTALLSVRLGVNRLLSGILVMTMLYSVCLRVMGKSNIPLKDKDNLLSQLEGKDNSYWLVTGVFLVLCLALYGFVYWLLNSEYGLHLRAVGPSADIVSAMGRNQKRLVIVGLTLSNGFIGLCGAMTAHVVGLADVNMGSGMLITGLAGLYLGRSFFNGIRTIPAALSAALLGTFAYQVVKNAALRVGLSTNDLKMITALLVIIALLLRRGKRTEDGEEALV